MALPDVRPVPSPLNIEFMDPLNTDAQAPLVEGKALLLPTHFHRLLTVLPQRDLSFTQLNELWHRPIDFLEHVPE